MGRFGFLDSTISLYVGRVDGSGDLMECVVKKWWLRERIVGRVLRREVAERERVREKFEREQRVCEQGCKQAKLCRVVCV